MNKFKLSLSQKQKVLTAASLPVAAIVLVLGFQNCSPGVVQSSRLASTGNTAASTNLDDDTKPTTVLHAENTLVSMQQVTGLQTPSARTLAAANGAKTKWSESGKVDTVNAPGLMGLTNVAGEVCLDLITEEKAKTVDVRRFFNQVDFTQAPSKLTAANKSDLIRRMARNFWGRPETVSEKTVLLASIDSAIADPKRTGVTDAVDSEDMMVFTCTGMLSVLDAFTFK